MRSLGVLVAAAVTASGLALAAPAIGSVPSTTAHPAVANPASPSTITWGACPTGQYPDLAGTKVKCAALRVPMNYSDPTGPKITLEVSMLRHTSTAAAYKGVILSNPGGPGGTSLDLPLYLEPQVPNGVGRDYDWVSWDPRGVGSSKPALHCQNGYFDAPRRSYIPTTKSLLHYWLSRSKSYANACEQKYPELLKNMTTIDSAKDMESIRTALGVAKISYYGFSYGTYLGQVYSTLFPTHLKYMVLDSNVDPRRVWYGANLDQDRAFQRNIKIYFRWTAKYDSVYHLGTTEKSVEALFYKELAHLTAHPAGRLGPDEFTDALLGAAYYRFGWEAIASAWRAYALHGRPGPLVSQYVSGNTPGNDNGFAVYNAVQCTDVQWPTQWSRWQQDNNRIYKNNPFLTWDNAWFNAPCLYWGAPAHRPVKINGTATKSVLLIDETLDAATPFSGSLEVRRLYPHSSLIAEPGGATHADSLSNDLCVDNKIASYLATGHLPPRMDWNGPDALCRPLPDPNPTAGGFKTRPRITHLHTAVDLWRSFAPAARG
jgi:pimeloyl-ACP methyl ester carboxylesterase